MKGTYMDDDRVEFITDINAKEIPVNTAVTLGLLLNELITNSIKHAFSDGTGEIRIVVKNKNPKTYKVLFEDNGNGFDEEIFEKPETLGINLIHSFLNQLDASYTINTYDKFRLDVEFSEQE